MAESNLFDEFKAFIKRGNVLDMAVGVVIGIAFGAISKSLVDDVIMPVVGMILGRVDFTNLFVTLKVGEPVGPYQTLAEAREAGAVTINYGNFVNSIVNFLIVAAAVFAIVKVVQLLNEEGEPESTPATSSPRRCPFCRTEVANAATRCPACTSELEAEAELEAEV